MFSRMTSNREEQTTRSTDPIENLKSIIGVESIECLDDIAFVNQFVFSIVPCPQLENMRTKLKTIKMQEWPIYFDCWKKRRCDPSGCLGNWCGFHARLLIVLLKRVYKFMSCKMWGYGLKNIVNHVATMVVWKGKRYNFDPYFGLHYATTNGEHMTFDQLKRHISKKEFEKIQIHYADGDLVKSVMTKVGRCDVEHEWKEMNSKEFYEHITRLFIKAGSLSALKRKFGHTEHMALMLLT